MLGVIMNDKEQEEIQYLLKREMEEIMFDLGDHRMNQNLKMAMEERYDVLFQIFRRFAAKEECVQYMPRRKKHN